MFSKKKVLEKKPYHITQSFTNAYLWQSESGLYVSVEHAKDVRYDRDYLHIKLNEESSAGLNGSSTVIVPFKDLKGGEFAAQIFTNMYERSKQCNKN